MSASVCARVAAGKEKRSMGTGSQRRQGMKRAMTLATAIAAMALGGGTTLAQPAATTQPAESSAAAPQRSSFSRSAEQEITFQEGLLLYSRNDLARAEANFRSLVEANPADAESHYYLGLTLLDQRKSAAAVESFDRSLRLDPTRTEVRAARATALIRLKRFDDARQDLAALEGDPRWQSLSAYLRGQLLYGEGDLEGAAKAFAQARALGSEEAEAAEF
jgi:tetratricopeptide (TPR) repeat protein